MWSPPLVVRYIGVVLEISSWNYKFKLYAGCETFWILFPSDSNCRRSMSVGTRLTHGGVHPDGNTCDLAMFLSWPEHQLGWQFSLCFSQFLQADVRLQLQITPRFILCTSFSMYRWASFLQSTKVFWGTENVITSTVILHQHRRRRRHRHNDDDDDHHHHYHIVLSQAHSLFQIEFSTECDLVLPGFLKVHSVAASVFFLIFPSLNFPSVTCLTRQLPRKLWPIQSAVFVLFCVGHLFPPWLFVILLYFSHGRSSWSFHSSSQPHFRTSIVSDPLSEVSSFQHQTKLCSKCGISPVSSLNLSHGSRNTNTHTHIYIYIYIYLYIWAFRNKLKREKLTGEGRNYTARSNAFCDIRAVDSGMTTVCGNAARIIWECVKHLSCESWRERTVWET